VVRAEVARRERQREADREAARLLRRHAPVAEHDEELVLVRLRDGRERAGLADQRLDPGAVRRAAGERAERIAQGPVLRVTEGLVVVEDRLVAPARLLEREAGEQAPEPDEGRL